MNSTVKRKFNALLQGIGNRPSSSVSTTDPDSVATNTAVTDINNTRNETSLESPSSSTMLADSEFLTKRRRLGASGSLAAKLGYGTLHKGSDHPQTPARNPTATTTISNITLRKWTPNGTAAAKEQEVAPSPPKYCPGDREQLVRRLATFQELTEWTPKPERVSEIEWAKRGWVCQGKERVKCILCRKELVVKLNRKEVDGREVSVLVASEIADALVDKYVELMETAHQEDCLWRKQGCDGSLLRLPLPTPAAALASLKQRYDELIVCKDFLPYEFNLRLPDGLNIDAVLSYLPPDFFNDPPPAPGSNAPSAPAPAPQPNRAALALALLGWQGLVNARGQPVPNSASCHTCLRRLGLWMFRSKEVDGATGAVLVPAAMDHLDPLREHRFFCPWKSGKAQRNPGARPLPAGQHDRAAWELLVQVLRNEAFVRSRTGPGGGGGCGGGSALTHSRSKSAAVPAPQSAPTTPGRPATAHAGEQDRDGIEAQLGDDADLHGAAEAEDEAVVSRKKDQMLLARLRRVKSLFNTKGSSKLKRASNLSGSRPGTAHSGAAHGE